MDAVAHVDLPSCAGLLSGRRLCRRRLLGPPERTRRNVTPDLGAAPSRSRAWPVGGLRRGGVGDCRRVRSRGSGELDPGIRGLGGGHAPVVSRRVRDRRCAHADSDGGPAPLGTSRAGCGRVRPGRSRRCHTGRPHPVSAVAELSALLGAAVSARNRLAARPVSRSQGRAAGRRFGVRAVAADLARPLPDQHDRRARPSGAEHRATVGGDAGVRLRAGRTGSRFRARGQRHAEPRGMSASAVREPTAT